MTEGEIRQKGIRALVAKRMMTSVSRARERGETQGFMKVAVDAESRKILGAAILGIGGDEIIHALLDAMAAGTPADTIIRTMHIHPTVSEYLPTILQDLKPLEQTIS
jgi:pyruvate/2-oxoglutarate dehydrogenase complex dihydrolipoamide dehydrogenase (E3) component